MTNTNDTDLNNSALDVYAIKDKIDKLKFLGEDKDLTVLTAKDLKLFRDLSIKSDRTIQEDTNFSIIVEKIMQIFSLYDEAVSEALQYNEEVEVCNIDRVELKESLETKYWVMIVEAYKKENIVNLDVLANSHYKEIEKIHDEYTQFTEQAMLCLLGLPDFSSNNLFNTPERIVSLAQFDDRYFRRPEVKRMLEKEPRLFCDVLNYYPHDHEISELKIKYEYVNHFLGLADYLSPLPIISAGSSTNESSPKQPRESSNGFDMPVDLSPIPNVSNDSPIGNNNLGRIHIPVVNDDSYKTPYKNRLSYSESQSPGYDATPLPDLRNESTATTAKDVDSLNYFIFHEANRKARALVLPHVVSPNRISDRKKLAHVQKYFIDFLLSNVGYLNVLIVDACFLNDDELLKDSNQDNDSNQNKTSPKYIKKNIDKPLVFDFLMRNRSLLLTMLNLLPENSNVKNMDSSVLAKSIACMKSVNGPSFQKEMLENYKAVFSKQELDPILLKKLVTQLLAWQLNSNEEVFKRIFMALSLLEPNLSAENKKNWLNLLIELALQKPGYATKLLDRRYAFPWFSNQSKAHLEIADIKNILLRSLYKDGSESMPRYVDAQIALVFSRRFFYLVSADAMKFSGEDLLTLLDSGKSELLGLAISTNPYYLNKILHTLNKLFLDGKTQLLADTLKNLREKYPDVFDSLEKEHVNFKFWNELSFNSDEKKIEVFEFHSYNKNGVQKNMQTGAQVNHKPDASVLPNQQNLQQPLDRQVADEDGKKDEVKDQQNGFDLTKLDFSRFLPQQDLKQPLNVNEVRHAADEEVKEDGVKDQQDSLVSAKLDFNRFLPKQDDNVSLDQQELKPAASQVPKDMGPEYCYALKGDTAKQPAKKIPTAFLGSIASAGGHHSFFSEKTAKLKQSRERIQNQLESIFQKNNIQLKDPDEWTVFTTQIQKVKHKSAAIELIGHYTQNVLSEQEQEKVDISISSGGWDDHIDGENSNISMECRDKVVKELIAACASDLLWAKEKEEKRLESMEETLAGAMEKLRMYIHN